MYHEYWEEDGLRASTFPSAHERQRLGADLNILLGSAKVPEFFMTESLVLASIFGLRLSMIKYAASFMCGCGAQLLPEPGMSLRFMVEKASFPDIPFQCAAEKKLIAISFVTQNLKKIIRIT